MAHTISALSVQKRNPQRVNVYLDGEFAFGLARVVAGWLQIGQSLTDERIAELQAEDQYETAYLRALHYLDYRPRTQVEIERKLKEHEVPDGVIISVLERLTELGLVNDARFVETWIENRSEFRPRGRRVLKSELRLRGVDEELIEQSLETLDEEALAYQAGLKHVRKLENQDWQNFRQKMLGFLARRGFSYDVSAPTTARIWAETRHIEQFVDYEG
jgi:regulatory protein